jgi:hypothetical protein
MMRKTSILMMSIFLGLVMIGCKMESGQEDLNQEKKSMDEKVLKLGLKRDNAAYLYRIDNDGGVSRLPKTGKFNSQFIMVRDVEKAPWERIVQPQIKHEDGYIYWLGQDGDIYRKKMPESSK